MRTSQTPSAWAGVNLSRRRSEALMLRSASQSRMATRRRRASAIGLGLLLLGGLTVCAHAQPGENAGTTRDRIPLNGTWDSALVPADVKFADIAEWQPYQVPEYFRVTPQDAPKNSWVKRSIDIPADWKDHRVFLHIGGALYIPTIYIDGKLVGSQYDGWSHAEIELTDAITPGQTHELVVLCHDQSAVHSEGVTWGSEFNEENRRGHTIALLGGYKDHIGIWDDIWLEATPASRIVQSELLILPSTRKQELTVSGKVDGPTTGLSVEAVVLDGDDEVLRISAAQITADGSWSLNESFPNARCWSPEDPHLYTLRIILRQDADGPVVDQWDQRFGFKEVWIEGPDFYLNGIKRHMLAASHWPPSHPQTREYIRGRLVNYKATNANTFRPHIGGWQKAWYEIADEVGLMIIPEAPAYTDGTGMYGYTDDRFWENYRDNVVRMIRHYRNHASVVMFSLGNELIYMGNTRYDAQLPDKLGELANHARQFHPHHPYTMEADIDPGDDYDVIGLHYPHEMPNFFDFPNTGDWLAERVVTEAGGGMLGEQRTDFYWERTKPLYIGEYLWIPIEDYSVGAIYFGEDAFLNRDRYWYDAKLAAHFDQTIAYRRANVTGLCPWGPSTTYREYFRHVGAFLYNRDNRCFAGDQYTLAFDVFNDSPKPLNLTLQVLEHDPHSERNPLVSMVEKQFTLEPGGYHRVEMPFTAPDVQSPTDLNFDFLLKADGTLVQTTQHQMSVEPKRNIKLPDGYDIYIYNPNAEDPKDFTELPDHRDLDGLAAADINTIILVIDPGTLGGPQGDGEAPVIGANTFDTAAFLNWVNRGGRAVVLEQSTLRPLGLDLDVVEHTSTMTFAVDPSHPILNGVPPEALKFWRDDHYVTRYEISRATHSGARSVTVSGGPNTLGQSPIVEMPVGKGHVVFLQALVGQKLEREPAAFRIAENTFAYLAVLPKPEPDNQTIALTDDEAFLKQLDALGVDYVKAADNQSGNASLVILHGAAPADAALSAHLAGGGRIYWHMPDPDSFEQLKDVLGLESLKVEQMTAGATIRKRNAQLLRGVSRQDLTYTTNRVGWRRTITLLPSVASVFVPTNVSDQPLILLRPAGQRRFGGQEVGNSVVFNGPGSLFAELSVNEPGLYRLTVTASTGNEQGDPPHIKLFVNNVIATVLFPTGDDPAPHTALIELPAGPSQLRLQPESAQPARPLGSVMIDKIELYPRVQYPDDVKVLTLPGSIISAHDSAVVLDGTPWESEGPNTANSRRYASALLSNLGATFKVPQPGPIADALPLRGFTLVGESPYSDLSPSQIGLRTNGLIEAPFRCAATGEYVIHIRANSSPVGEEYCKLRVMIDGQPVGEIELKSQPRQSEEFDTAPVSIVEGEHRLGLEFFNDGSAGDQDRNLTIEGVSFTR